MSYVTLADLAQAPAAAAPVAPAVQAEPSTGSIVAGIVGGILTAGATVGVGILNAQTQRSIAKDQAKSQMKLAMIEQQNAARQAMLAASMPPAQAPSTGIDVKTIAIIGGAGLVGVVVLALALGGRGSGKKRKKDDERTPQYQGWGGPPGPWGPPPVMGYAPPPAWGPPPVSVTQVPAANPPGRRKKAARKAK